MRSKTERHSGLGLQAAGHQHERYFQKARKIATMCLKLWVHPGNPGQAVIKFCVWLLVLTGANAVRIEVAAATHTADRSFHMSELAVLTPHAVANSSSEELFEQLQSLSDVTQGGLPLVYPEQIPVQQPDRSFLTLAPIVVVITTSAVAASVQSRQHPENFDDVYLVSHDFSFLPQISVPAPNRDPITALRRLGACAVQFPRDQGYAGDTWRFVSSYRISVSSLDAATASRKCNFPAALIDPEPAKFTFIKTSPDTTIGATQVTTSISHTFSGNVGFFGMVFQGDISNSITLSKSKTYSIPDVRVYNQSSVNSAKFLFEIADNAPISKTTFQPSIQFVCVKPDNKAFEAQRSPKPADALTAPVVAFNINISATLGVWYVEEGGDPNTRLPFLDHVGGVDHVVLVRMPILPGQGD